MTWRFPLPVLIRGIVCAVALMSTSAQARAIDLTAVPFQDAGGQERTLAAFKGKRVLLNLWATWCAPCVAELPALDRLAHDLDGKITVVAVSVDRKPADALMVFFAEHELSHLTLFRDPSAALLKGVDVPGIPVSLLFNENGKEIDRFVGAAEWDSPAIRAKITK